jgi:uncharacterized membrane protein
MKKQRIWELDFLRGFAIIMMIFDHLMYDFRNLNSFFSNFNTVDNPVFNWLNDIARLYWSSELRFYGHIFFISLFLLISGISFTFSKNNLSRGLKLGLVALLINLVTFLIEEFAGLNIFILFGVIHMFATSIIITFLLRKLWNNDWFILIIGLIVISIGIYIEFWDLKYLQTWSLADLPKIIIGLNAYGADSFSIFPYTGIIMIGTVIGNQFYKNRISLIPNVKIGKKNIVNWIGKNSLLIFLTHQIALMGLIFLIGYLFGYRA